MKNRNFFVSYLKGLAIIFIVLIHLFDWSNQKFGIGATDLKSILYIGLLIFIALVGSVVIIAYSKYDDISKATFRLITRSFQLLGVYYFFNIIKFYIFDFSKEDFYLQYIERGIFDVYNIITLHSYSMPITILTLIAFLVLISPIFLRISQKTKYPKSIITGLIIIFLIINYILPHPDNNFINFLYAKNPNDTVAFSILYWIVPYLIGVLIAMFGFEKQRKFFLGFFGIMTLIFGGILVYNHQTLLISEYMYPLRPYYLSAGFFGIFVLLEILIFLQKLRFSSINFGLALLAFWGDKSLIIYIGEWIVIDFTIYFFTDRLLIYWTVLLMFLVYSAINYKIIYKYFQHINIR